jgi:hypothetical protein
MPGRRARMVQRDRSTLDLEVLHVEISKESREFLKKYAGAKQMPMGGALDVILKKKAKALGFIQT